MKITTLYASLLAILFVFLSIRTIRVRRKQRIAVGDAGDKEMLRAMRVHANFAEYVPLALILVFLVESNLAHPGFVHFLGATLLIARGTHAYGVSQVKENFKFRVSGMTATFTVLLASAAYLLYVYICGPT